LTPCVIDASVTVKWFLPEPHSAAAIALLRAGHALLAPDLLWAEFGNALAKRCQTGELTIAEATRMTVALERYSISFHATRPLVPRGLQIAATLGRTLYDSLYLALAVQAKAELVTADQKYVEAVRRSPWAKYVLWIEDAV
jgi:predicted nucleic acid-binding protein